MVETFANGEEEDGEVTEWTEESVEEEMEDEIEQNVEVNMPVSAAKLHDEERGHKESPKQMIEEIEL